MESQEDADMDVSVTGVTKDEGNIAEFSLVRESLGIESTDKSGMSEEGKSRLLITKMTMKNFKSYGGTREIGPFHKCFSSIVGPNGSGKSNVIDAMLFVFGKNAKKLRQQKVSELIHRSETYPDFDHTSVSVYFVDIVDDTASEDAYEEIPGTELMVTRTAYANNTSKYQIDGKNSTFKEVGALLRKRGVDLDNNRFLILQGEVEQIAMMKPKALTPSEEGLLEYLEDIIGSDRFVEAAEEAAREVETLSEQRIEKLNRLKLVEKEKDSLQGARDQAEGFLRLEATIRSRNNVLYQCHIANAEANVERISSKAKSLQERLEHERNKLKDTKEKAKETAARHKAVSGEHAALKKVMETVKEQFTEYERKDIKRIEKEKFLKEQMRKLESSIKRDHKKAEESLKRAEELEGGMKALEAAVTQAEARKRSEETALEEVNESLKGKTDKLRERLEEAQEEAGPVREETEALRHKVETHKCEICLVKESAESAKNRLSGVKSAVDDILDTAGKEKKELSAARDEIRSLGGEIEKAKEEVVKAEESVAEASDAMAQAVSAAEEAKVSLEVASGRTGALKSLLEAARPGGPLAGAGVCGRLGDLGVIPAQHDIAVSTACSKLDNIVVETVAGATQCVEYLRSNSMGRATFVILERLGHLKDGMNRPFHPPRGCTRLFDTINVTERRFLPAMYLGLGDTLVAPNLDSAVANAYQGGKCVFRIVTADGQLIDRSGAMSGGGNSVRRGGMRTTGGGSGSGGGTASAVSVGVVSPEEVNRLSQVAAKAEEVLRFARQAKRELEGKVKTLTARGRVLETLIPKLELRLEGVEATVAQYREQIHTLEGQCQLSPEAATRLEEIEGLLANDEKDLVKASKALAKAENSIKSLQTQIMDVGGDRLKKAVKRAEAAARALDEAVAAVNMAAVGSKGERKKGDKAANDARKKEKDLQDLSSQAEEAAKAFKGLEDDAAKVFEAYEQAQEDVANKAQELGVIAEEHKKAKTLEDTIMRVEVDICTKLEDMNKGIKENRSMSKNWGHKLDDLLALHKKEFIDSGVSLEKEEGEEEDEGEEDTDDEDMQGCGDNTEANEEMKIKGSTGGEGEGEEEALKTNKALVASVDGNTHVGKRVVEGGSLPEFSTEELESVSIEDLKFEIAELEAERKKKESEVNLTALKNYCQKEKEYLGWVSALEAATSERNAARGRHEDLRRRRLEEFMAGFGQITLRLKEMYQMITLGGDAELELVDSLDPFSEGIVFSVRPPKKSWKNIANLSGGEKTLSSLALVFALHHFKPTPLYVMDEIDAALDFKNVSIVANYIKERTKNAQFIIISLRNNMFELADRLVGIYKTHNVTKSVTINPKTFAAAQGYMETERQKQGGSRQSSKSGGGGRGGVLGDSTNTLPKES